MWVGMRRGGGGGAGEVRYRQDHQIKENIKVREIRGVFSEDNPFFTFFCELRIHQNCSVGK